MVAGLGPFSSYTYIPEAEPRKDADVSHISIPKSYHRKALPCESRVKDS